MKGAVKAYYESMMEENGDDYIDACFSPEYLKAYEDRFKMDRAQLAEHFEATLEYDNFFAYEQDVKVIGVTVKKKWSKSDVINYMKEIEDSTGVEVNISEIVNVKVNFALMLGDGWWQPLEDYLKLYRVGMKWYVLDD